MTKHERRRIKQLLGRAWQQWLGEKTEVMGEKTVIVFEDISGRQHCYVAAGRHRIPTLVSGEVARGWVFDDQWQIIEDLLPNCREVLTMGPITRRLHLQGWRWGRLVQESVHTLLCLDLNPSAHPCNRLHLFSTVCMVKSGAHRIPEFASRVVSAAWVVNELDEAIEVLCEEPRSGTNIGEAPTGYSEDRLPRMWI